MLSWEGRDGRRRKTRGPIVRVDCIWELWLLPGHFHTAEGAYG